MAKSNEIETAKKRDAALALSTPHKPHKPLKAKAKKTAISRGKSTKAD